MSKVRRIFRTYRIERLVTSSKVGEWCLLPYPNHKGGCPNYGRKGCPPGAGSIGDLVDLSQPIYLVAAAFNLEYQAEKMRKKYPHWTDRQCRCCLYWQGKVRAHLRRAARAAMGFLGCDAYVYCPEGYGVNVFVTARLAGLKLDKTRRIKIDHHVALIGTKKESTTETQRAQRQ